MLVAGAPIALLGGCGQPPARVPRGVHCPDAAGVAPGAIGGAAFVANLTGRLAGSDRENVVAEAVAEMRRAAPDIGDAAITNVLIAADCPLAAARPDHDAAADRDRIATFRAQIAQILATAP